MSDHSPSKTRLRGWLLAAAALVALALALAGGLKWLSSGDLLKRGLQHWVAEHTDYDLRIGGTAELSIAPPLTLTATDLVLSGGPDNASPFEAEVAKAALRVSLRSLFRGRLDVDRIQLDGLRVRWDEALWGEVREIRDIALSLGPLRDHSPLAWAVDMPIVGLWGISQGRLHGEGELLVAQEGGLLGASPVRLQLDDVITSAARQGELQLAGVLSGDLESRRFRIADLQGTVALDLGAAPGGRLAAALAGEAALDLPAQALDVANLTVAVGEMQIACDLNIEAGANAPVAKGHLVLRELDLREWAARQGVSWPGDASSWRRVAGHTELMLTDGRLALGALELQLDQTRARGEVGLALDGPTRWDFDLDVDVLDLDRYVSNAPGPSEAAADEMPLQPTPPRGATPESGQQSELTLARQSIAAREPTSQSSRIASVRRPFPLPQVARLEGRARVDRLVVADLVLAPAELTVRSEEGTLRIAQVADRDNLYGGRLTGRLDIDLADTPLRRQLVARARGVDVGALLDDLGAASALRGSGDIDLDLVARGMTREAVLSSLTGQVGLVIHDGTVPGLDLDALLAAARARATDEAGGQASVEGAAGARAAGTRFSELSATLVARDGVLETDDLRGSAESFTLTGRGTLALLDRQIDLSLYPVLSDAPRSRRLKELEGIPIPVQLSGPLAQPTWSVDLAPVLREVARRRLDERGSEALERLEERLGIEGLEDSIRRFLGR